MISIDPEQARYDENLQNLNLDDSEFEVFPYYVCSIKFSR